MTKWEADYPFYHKLKAGPIKATVCVGYDEIIASVVGNIDVGDSNRPNEASAKEWCKDELRKIRDRINEALDE